MLFIRSIHTFGFYRIYDDMIVACLSRMQYIIWEIKIKLRDPQFTFTYSAYLFYLIVDKRVVNIGAVRDKICTNVMNHHSPENS